MRILRLKLYLRILLLCKLLYNLKLSKYFWCFITLLINFIPGITQKKPPFVSFLRRQESIPPEVDLPLVESCCL